MSARPVFFLAVLCALRLSFAARQAAAGDPIPEGDAPNIGLY
jgi:hypothetical protein